MPLAHTTAKKSTTVRFNMTHRMIRIAASGLSRIAPETASRLAMGWFLSPPRHRPPSREMDWADGARRCTLPWRNQDLAAWVWGDGPRTALLVHGWGGRGLQMGAFVEPLLAAGFRVVTFDQPGHGLSPGKRSSLPEMAGAVASVIHDLHGVDAVIAHSIGAAATTAALGEIGEGLQVGALAYVSPAVDLFAVARRFSHLTGLRHSVVDTMRRRIERRFGIEWRRIQGLTLAPRMDRPLVVFHDQDDREIDFHEGQELASAWPAARFVATRGLGHRRILRDDNVVRSATAFVDALGVVDRRREVAAAVPGLPAVTWGRELAWGC